MSQACDECIEQSRPEETPRPRYLVQMTKRRANGSSETEEFTLSDDGIGITVQAPQSFVIAPHTFSARIELGLDLSVEDPDGPCAFCVAAHDNVVKSGPLRLSGGTFWCDAKHSGKPLYVYVDNASNHEARLERGDPFIVVLPLSRMSVA